MLRSQIFTANYTTILLLLIQLLLLLNSMFPTKVFIYVISTLCMVFLISKLTSCDVAAVDDKLSCFVCLSLFVHAYSARSSGRKRRKDAQSKYVDDEEFRRHQV